eukprot:COSAG01_NODE_11018_length_2026_cov_1.459263_1_plen_87_part_00
MEWLRPVLPHEKCALFGPQQIRGQGCVAVVAWSCGRETHGSAADDRQRRKGYEERRSSHVELSGVGVYSGSGGTAFVKLAWGGRLR